MAAQHINRKPPRSNNPAPVRRPARQILRKPDPLREDLFHSIRKLQLAMAVVTATVGALNLTFATGDRFRRISPCPAP